MAHMKNYNPAFRQDETVKSYPMQVKFHSNENFDFKQYSL